MESKKSHVGKNNVGKGVRLLGGGKMLKVAWGQVHIRACFSDVCEVEVSPQHLHSP